jgi:hypothetical protein
MRVRSGRGTRTFRQSLKPWFILPAVLVTALAVALAGCGSGATDTTSGADSATSVVLATTTTAAPATTTTAPSTTTTTLAPTTTTTVAPTTTTAAPTTTTIPPDPKGWKRYTAGGISIAMPTSFKGGAPDSAALKAQVKKMVGGGTYISETQGFYSDMEMDWLIQLIGSTSKTRWIPMVSVLRTKMVPGDSLSFFAESWNSGAAAGATFELLSSTDTRMDYLVTIPKEGAEPASKRLEVFIESGEFLYLIGYSGTTVAFTQFYDAYKQSAARLKIIPASTTSTTGTGATTTTP